MKNRRFQAWMFSGFGGWLILISSWAWAATDAPAMLERVLPAVVTVTVEKAQAGQQPFGFGPGVLASAYERALDLTDALQTGSGFIILHQDVPYVVTNAHVIEQAVGADSVFVYTIDQRKLPVTVMGADSFYDIAVLKFKPDALPAAGTTALNWRTGPLRLGEPVYAIGNPAGTFGTYPYSVSDGIISGLNRVLSGLTAKFGYLQSTATLSWGNSGGPLVDAEGRVVGVNTRIEAVEKEEVIFVLPQINLSLESALAQRLVNDILAHGRVQRAFLGVEFAALIPRQTRQQAAYAQKVTLLSVVKDSPAAALTDRLGWRLTAVAGEPVRNLQEAMGAFERATPGAELPLTLEGPEGRKATATLKATLLTPDRLAGLARHALGRHIQARLDQTPRGVLFAVEEGSSGRAGTPVQGEKPAQREKPTNKIGNYRYRDKPRGYAQQEEQGGNQGVIVAAGVIASRESASLWRVATLADLGIALRLAAPSGVFDLVPADGNGERILRIRLADEPEVVAQTLFY